MVCARLFLFVGVPGVRLGGFPTRRNAPHSAFARASLGNAFEKATPAQIVRLKRDKNAGRCRYSYVRRHIVLQGMAGGK